MKLGGLKTIS